MNQFDVFRPRTSLGKSLPYLVRLNADSLSGLRHCIVAPLHPAAAVAQLARNLHVPLRFRGRAYVLTPEEIASVPNSTLGDYAGSLAEHRGEILAALDFLFTGY